MSEVQQSVQETPAVDPVTTEPTAATATGTEPTVDPVATQETPAESKAEAGTADSAAVAAPTEEKAGKGEAAITAQPINEGVLSYKGTGLKGLLFSKKYFWFSDAPLEHKHLTAYLDNEKAKDVAHPNAAHATQTGKGLLFFAKRAEDKEHPQGIFNLADITDVAKGNFLDFSITIHGHKHQFQAANKAEKDGWLVAIETGRNEAKTEREGIVGSHGYKSALEKYGTTTATATTGATRSLSRPKKASKSRERKTATTSTSDPVADTTTGTAAGPTTEIAPETAAEEPTHTEAGEAAAGTAVAGATAARTGSFSEEDKKNKKSRSQSRGKRQSLFGTLLGKKEEHDAKKEVKKEEKEEKKEEKAEAKAEKKEEKALEKESDPMSTGQTHGFDAHAIAARVIAEPEAPAVGATEGTTETAAVAEPVAAETSPAGTRENVPKPTKRNSLFGGLFGKKDATNPTATEAAPAVAPKDEPSALSSTAPQLDNPVTEPTAPAAPTLDTTEPTTTAAETTSPASNTTPTGTRRSSFFSNLGGTKKERKTGTTSDTEVTDGEGKKSGGFSGLLRKASRATNKNPNASGVVKDAPEVPPVKDTTAGAETTTDGAGEAEKPALTNGETSTPAIGDTHENTPVSAAA